MNDLFTRRFALAAFGLALVGGVLAADADAKKPAGSTLKGKRVAILVTDGFEQVEMTRPRKALDEAGAKTVLISPKAGQVKAWNTKDWGEKFDVDLTLDKAKPGDFDALLLPGGVMNPDKLRMNKSAVAFAQAFFKEHKPVAAICHGPWLLVEADVLRGRKVTSWPSLQTDIRNAGGTWANEMVVVDRGLVTSRKPEDIPAFNRKMLEEFAGGKADSSK